jgi:hypothetical protein
MTEIRESILNVRSALARRAVPFELEITAG